MTCCRLDELPAPPEGKTGWPWTMETEHIPEAGVNGKVWPKISIITPSYNQGRFIEETIRSVLLQRYPNLEYRIIDGGSNDDTLDIIRKYDRWISSWTSEPDRGQMDALNRGMPQASGQLLNWLNSDDLLLPGALFTIAELFSLDSDVDVVSGARLARSARTSIEVAWVPWLDKWPLISIGYPYLAQETTFFSRRIWNAIAKFDESLDYSFDLVFHWQAIVYAEKIVLTAKTLGVLHAHAEQKSLRQNEIAKKNHEIFRQLYIASLPWVYRVLVRLCHTRFWVIADAILRCLVYRRTKRKFQIGTYDWSEDKWILTSF
jgi:glycosyltransferase involved in cell wall biosynthesis